MMFKPFSMLLFIIVMIWVGSILITTDSTVRIQRTCEPINQAGIFSTSVAALASPSMPGIVKSWFDQRNYECRFAVWRQFYEADYMEQMNRMEQLKKEIAQIKELSRK